MDDTAEAQERFGDWVRGRQLHRMEKNLLPALVGYMGVAILTWLLFRDEWETSLGLWAGVSILLCGARAAYSVASIRRPAVRRAKRVVWYHAAADILMALSMSAGPIWVLFNSTGHTAIYMVLAVVSLTWAGAMVHLTVFPVAAVFIATQTAAWIAGAVLLDQSGAYLHPTLLFCAVSLIALLTGYQLSRWLEEGLRQRLQLEQQTGALRQQADTISLLLREHESETSDWLWHVDGSGRLRRVSKRFAAAFDRIEGDLAGTNLFDLLEAPDIDGNEQACLDLREHIEAARSFQGLVIPGRVGAERRWWLVSGRSEPPREGGAYGFRGVMSDITAERQARAEAEHLSQHDSLTDTPNRRTFLQLARRQLEKRPGGRFAFVNLDLDNFSPVNGRYGDAVGDAVLMAVAGRVQAALYSREFVARLAGDEFVIMIDAEDGRHLEDRCSRLISEVARPIHVDGLEIRVGASLGISLAPDDGVAPDALLKNAHLALLRVKSEGRGSYRFFSAAIDQKVQEREGLLQDLREALSNGELVPYYQPAVDALTGDIRGYEALLRWQHPHRGHISPADFIALAEESGLIRSIGAWILNAACVEARTWGGGWRVSVNISPVQFQDGTLPDIILEALTASGLPAHLLEVELTENVLVCDIDQALHLLRRIRALGVRVALDDFGTGYSSLGYLQSFPFDRIKIDRTFVRDLEAGSDSEVIVRAVCGIARGLGMSVTAEGIESSAQADILRAAECHEFQGFFYGRPQPRETIAHRADERFRDGRSRLATDVS